MIPNSVLLNNSSHYDFPFSFQYQSNHCPHLEPFQNISPGFLDPLLLSPQHTESLPHNYSRFVKNPFSGYLEIFGNKKQNPKKRRVFSPNKARPLGAGQQGVQQVNLYQAACFRMRGDSVCVCMCEEQESVCLQRSASGRGDIQNNTMKTSIPGIQLGERSVSHP